MTKARLCNLPNKLSFQLPIIAVTMAIVTSEREKEAIQTFNIHGALQSSVFHNRFRKKLLMKTHSYPSLFNHINDGMKSFLYISCAIKPHVSVRPQRRLQFPMGIHSTFSFQNTVGFDMPQEIFSMVTSAETLCNKCILNVLNSQW